MMVILIPAFEPDEKLIELVDSIAVVAPQQPIVVVDDGSGESYQSIFAQVRSAGYDVVVHSTNRGKGLALKTGCAYIVDHYPAHDVVCADCDGQHSLVDILRVAEELRGACAAQPTIVLGARQFAGDVPARSRFGNAVTRRVFRVSAGLDLQDTQTGLRGYQAAMLPWLQTVHGERFEYETEVLLAARRAGVTMSEVPITTIYLEGNESSHFNPIRDSIRIYLPFVKFSLSSIIGFVIDVVVLMAMMGLSDGNLALSVVVARLCSATVNYLLNRRLVFGQAHRRVPSALRYAALATGLLAANYLLLSALRMMMPLLPAKVLTEVVLFLASYRVQQRFVFGRAPGGLAKVADSQQVHSQQPAACQSEGVGSQL